MSNFVAPVASNKRMFSRFDSCPKPSAAAYEEKELIMSVGLTGLDSDYGGHLPDSVRVTDAHVQTEKEYILARIDYYKNNNHLSDMKTVQALFIGAVVGNGRDGWYWLKKWYEQQQAELEKPYREATDICAKSIDEINQRLKEFDR